MPANIFDANQDFFVISSDNLDAKQGEIITLHLEWLPHRETRTEL